MFAELRHLARRSLTYAFGEALRSSLAFVLLPLYTRVLTPADYGILGVVGPVYGILSIVVGLGLQSALMRFYFDHEAGSPALRRYVGAVATFMWGSSLVTGLILFAGGPRLFALLMPKTAFDPYIALAVANACLSVAALVPLVLFRAQERPLPYVAFTVTDFAVTTGLVILFVAALRQGALGNLRAQVIAASLMAVPAIFISLRHGTPNLDWPPIRSSLAFSLPLLPHLLGNWALNVSDRIVLDRYVSKPEVGLYTLGYQFGLLLNIVGVALNNAWVPFFYQRAGERESRRLVALSITYQVMLITWLSLAVALLAREAIEIMAKPAYWSAYLVVPLIVAGYLARYLYFFPVNALFYAKRTRWVPVATLAAAAANIVLNLWLVPRYGILAAAANTCVGFSLLLAIISLAARHVYRIEYEAQRLGRILLLGAGLFAVGWWLAPDGLLGRLIFKLAVVGAFPLLLWVSGTLSTAERRRIVGEIRRVAPRDVPPAER